MLNTRNMNDSGYRVDDTVAHCHRSCMQIESMQFCYCFCCCRRGRRRGDFFHCFNCAVGHERREWMEIYLSHICVD